MKSVESVLIVDDENTVHKSWTEALEKQGYDIAQATSMDQAQAVFSQHNIGLALVNLKSNGHVRGLDLLDWIKENNPNTDVILVSSYSNLESSISALAQGGN